jgi:hypothetical protein
MIGGDFPLAGIGGKWLGLLKEAVPGLIRAAVMFNPETSPQSKFFMRSAEAGGASLGMRRASSISWRS